MKGAERAIEGSLSSTSRAEQSTKREGDKREERFQKRMRINEDRGVGEWKIMLKRGLKFRKIEQMDN